jgi:hypothetical protein
MNAFQTTQDDIFIILFSNPHYKQNLTLRPDLRHKEQELVAENVFEDLTEEQLDRIEKAALYGDDMDTQTDYVFEEIKDILVETGVLVQPD